MKAYDIERYINGELEGEELQEFESLLSADSELRDEVNRTREVLDQLKQLSISERIRKAQQKNIEVKRWRIILFISILSLGILFLVFYIRSGSDEKTIGPSAESENQIPTSDSMLLENQNPTELPIDTEKIQVKEIPVAKKSEYREEPKYEEIAMNYYSTPEEFAYLRGMTSKSIMDSARMAFNNEDYYATLKLLNTLDKNDPFVEYFKAHVYFKLKNFQDANLLFNHRLSNEDSKIKKQEIEWYNLLSHLACGQKCKTSFTKSLQSILSDPNHNYYLQAKNMQGLLDVKH